MEPVEQVLIALRQIIRATDLHSSHLAKTTGMTAPQILLLRAILEQPKASVGEIARDISLSQATVTAIVSRLEKRGLVYRERSSKDKRVVHARLTETGRGLLKVAPLPLQDQFTQQFQELENWEQTQLLSTLQRVAQMMDAHTIDASPVLDIGKLDRQHSINSTQEEITGGTAST